MKLCGVELTKSRFCYDDAKNILAEHPDWEILIYPDSYMIMDLNLAPHFGTDTKMFRENGMKMFYMHSRYQPFPAHIFGTKRITS